MASCLTAAGIACAPPTVVQKPTAAPPSNKPPVDIPPTAPSKTVPEAIPRHSTWTFSYFPATYVYGVTTSAEVTSLTDTTQRRSVPAVVQYATIAIDSAGTVKVISPEVVSGSDCDAAAALAARAQQLVPVLPANMVVGMTWNDSTVTTGCRGSIPATSHTAHTYTVVGDTIVGGVPALHVHRADTISASGEGAEGQHRVIVAADGMGSAELFFDVAKRRFLGSDETQITTVQITTSGRLTSFLQHVTEQVTLRGIQ